MKRERGNGIDRFRMNRTDRRHAGRLHSVNRAYRHRKNRHPKEWAPPATSPPQARSLPGSREAATRRTRPLAAQASPRPHCSYTITLPPTSLSPRCNVLHDSAEGPRHKLCLLAPAPSPTPPTTQPHPTPRPRVLTDVLAQAMPSQQATSRQRASPPTPLLRPSGWPSRRSPSLSVP